MREIRIAVVGLGFGEHHVRTLANLGGARLVAVADTVVERLTRVGGQHGLEVFEDGVRMLDETRPDAVSLCVSPRFREPLIRAALDRGIALFVEKPWASDPAQARSLADLCRGARVPVMVGFSFRFHPVVVRLRELVAGELGRPWLANGEYVFDWIPPAGHWLWDPANGGGFFVENSCHLFDVLCAVLGEPREVTALAATFRGSPGEEAAAAAIRFEGGALAAVTIGGVGAGPFHGFPRLDVCTEHGRAELSGIDHTWLSLVWGLRGDRDTRRYVAPPEALGTTRYTAAFVHFLDCVRRGSAPEATVEHGVRAVDLAHAVYRSARTGELVRLGGVS